jgi:hypothetical protein
MFFINLENKEKMAGAGNSSYHFTGCYSEPGNAQLFKICIRFSRYWQHRNPKNHSYLNRRCIRDHDYSCLSALGC